MHVYLYTIVKVNNQRKRQYSVHATSPKQALLKVAEMKGWKIQSIERATPYCHNFYVFLQSGRKESCIYYNVY